ncbi:MAG: LytTR family transcriptional regulator [Bacteroidales bacterium]|nr:LytTR family transcriptional regulator [Bacteroidales bacterium]
MVKDNNKKPAENGGQQPSSSVFAGIGSVLLLMPLIVASLVTTGVIRIDFRGFWQIFLEAFLYGLLTIGAAYLLVALHFVIKDRANIIRLMNMGDVVSDSFPAPQDEQIITLFDNDGDMKLSVRLRNIFFIESDDNYIKVWYADNNGEVKQYMLRCRLKTVEESFAGSDLVRCHRKYIVNLSRIETLTRQKEGYYIDLGIETANALPVSKTYEASVLARFNARQ